MSTLLPDLAKMLPNEGFMSKGSFGIIYPNETSRIRSADAASAVEALSADGDNGRHREGES